MSLVATASIYQKIPIVCFWFDLCVVLWFLAAVYFISKLTKFQLIIITIFEYNYVLLSPNLRINVLVNALLSDRYVDITPTTTMGAARGGTRAMVTKIYKFHNVSYILPILQKGRTTVEWTWWRHRNANNIGVSPPKFNHLQSRTTCRLRQANSLVSQINNFPFHLRISTK